MKETIEIAIENDIILEEIFKTWEKILNGR